MSAAPDARAVPVAAPQIGAEEQAAVAAVLASGHLVQGPQVAAFEEEFCAQAVPGRRGVAVNSGTSALHVGLLALGVGPGDEVVVPSFTFAATANAVRLAGATPVFADVDPVSFCLDPASVEEVLTARTRALVPVHLFGHPADATALGALAERRGLLVLEDAAQAHAARWRGRSVGALGHAAAFSFYPTKNMTSGEGGMITTADPAVERAARLLRNQGMERRYHNEVVGLNVRMSDVHAAIGRVQLRRLAERTATRRANAAALTELLTAAAPEGVVLPAVAEGAEHVWHQYTVRLPGHERDRFAEELQRRGVGCAAYYPVPVHRLPAFADLGDPRPLPVTDAAAADVLSLPVHPALHPGDLERVAAAVAEVASSGAARPRTRR
ncbi:DegT/DnrJ/EryC1/StrS family aminotransferase [Kineococcus indalonis]|uniref:DegT/DnrJ/EryC1/StrS family aminotransferase n=1 Tax=Kineococcus indalonis TaxID=2696566 RepID=UPI0014131BCF|nr:DegT/DnrJ/EryC1/StrS family aminotransferase [Kineococcus indalonis]NAZ86048.1 aminotransferase class I/II-fold pyridoxal phosphate-dependent enzyme [Kineococcus indalonis]